MKTALIAGLIALTPTLAFAEAKLDKWQKSALQLVKKEKQVTEAKWRDPKENVLWVEVASDGSSRDGFAQYLCMVLMDAGAPENVLKTVWLYDKTGYVSGQSALGMAACR